MELRHLNFDASRLAEMIKMNNANWNALLSTSCETKVQIKEKIQTVCLNLFLRSLLFGLKVGYQPTISKSILISIRF